LIAAIAAAALVALPASDAWVVISRAQLQSEYDQLWAISDIHGHRDELDRLLTSARLVKDSHWDPDAKRRLLIIAGDLIDGGPDSAGVLGLVERITAEAPAAHSRVIALLGNHELRKLVRRSEPFLQSLPVAAFVGPWLFAHSGYIEADASEADLRAYFDRLAVHWAHGGHERYEQFSTGDSIVDRHHWSNRLRLRERMREQLLVLGLDAVVFGHDPAALGAPGTIALDPQGFLLKLDTGMKDGRSAGRLLRCSVDAALQSGLSACDVVLPDGQAVGIRSGVPKQAAPP
jgi:hypothetical protein